MQARMNNPAMVLPGAMEPIQALFKVIHQGGVDPATLELVHLRASQMLTGVLVEDGRAGVRR